MGSSLIRQTKMTHDHLSLSMLKFWIRRPNMENVYTEGQRNTNQKSDEMHAPTLAQ